jgi:hypothetical protein
MVERGHIVGDLLRVRGSIAPHAGFDTVDCVPSMRELRTASRRKWAR